jgi:PAS domain S-box-containing protein
LEMITEIKSQPAFRDIPIIMCTGVMLTPQHLKSALDAGANDYIRKPIDSIELEARVNSLLKYSESQQNLAKSETLFRSIFENSNIGVCLITKDGKFQKVNQEMSSIFGFIQAEFEQLNVNQIFKDEPVQISETFIKEAILKGEDKSEFERQGIHKNGKLLFCQISLSVINDSDENNDFYVAHIKDITEHKKAELELKLSEQKFNSIVTNADEAICVNRSYSRKVTGQITH